MTHRVGFLGVGLMGERMLKLLSQDSRFEAALAWDPDRRRLDEVSEQFSFVAAPDEGAFWETELDGVSIASPPTAHAAAVGRALSLDLPCLVEKPLTASVEEAKALRSSVNSSSTPVAVHFPFATVPQLSEIEERWAPGGSAKPLRLEMAFHFSSWPRSWHHAGAWLSGSEEGGFLREVLSHFVFLTQRVLGPIELRDAEGLVGGTGTESWVRAGFVAGGVPISLTGAVGGAAPDHHRWTLFGENASVRLEDWSNWFRSDAETWRPWILPGGEPSSRELMIDGVDQLFRREPNSLATVAESAAVVEVIEALHARVFDRS